MGKVMTQNINIDALFVTTLTTNVFEDIDNKKLLEFCLYMYKNYPSNNRSNRNGWQSQQLEYHKELDELTYNVKEVGSNIFKLLKGKDEWVVDIDNLWINVNTPGSYNTSHIHPRSFLSGVYYVKVPKDSGRIHFTHPCQSFCYDWDSSYFDELNNTNTPGMHYEPEEKRNYLFPSWLQHDVESNNSKEDRISISYNLKVVKK